MSTITIKNTSAENQYTLAINGQEVLCFFHVRDRGLSAQLRAAADAFEKDRDAQLMAIDEERSGSSHHVPVSGGFW